MLGGIRARASFMSRRRFATLPANRVLAASLSWPWSSSAPPTSASSLVVISNAYPESEAPTEIPASEAPRSWTDVSK